MVSENDVLEAG